MYWHPDKHDAPIRFQVDYSHSWQATELYAVKHEYGKNFVPVVGWSEHQSGEIYQPLLRLRDTEGPCQMQSLFDALWSAGFRPKQADKQDALVVAKNQHIEDLRQIIGKLFDK